MSDKILELPEIACSLCHGVGYFSTGFAMLPCACHGYGVDKDKLKEWLNNPTNDPNVHICFAHRSHYLPDIIQDMFNMW